MERVAFLIEETGERLACMLNPEGLVLQRHAGIRPARSLQGQLTGAGLSDDPLLYTGGGRTELTLDLLFDVQLPGSSTQPTDVRELTSPLWRLAENADADSRYGRPPLARFVWGKAWNIPGVVLAVAERFEQFTANGEPQRSWLRLRFARVSDRAAAEGAVGTGQGAALVEADRLLEDLAPTVLEDLAETTELAGIHTVSGEGTVGENLPLITYQYGLDPGLWPFVAWFNDIADPLRMAAGTILRIPALSLVERFWR